MLSLYSTQIRGGSKDQKPPPETKAIESKPLTCDSPFALLAQDAIDTYYKIPYPSPSATSATETSSKKRKAEEEKSPESTNNEVKEEKSKIPRPLHGGVHVACTASLVDFLIEDIKVSLSEKSAELLIHPVTKKPLTEKNIKLLMLGAIYHDSANTGEDFHDEEKHAEIFTKTMLPLNFDKDDIAQVAFAMTNKDNKSIEDNIYKILLQTADALNYVRLLIHDAKPDKFIIDKLDIFKIYRKNNTLGEHWSFMDKMKQMVSGQHKLMQYIYQPTIHEQCEFAPNCYEKTHLLLKQAFIHQYLKQIELSQLVIHGILGDTALALLAERLIKSVTTHEAWAGTINKATQTIIIDFLKTIIQQHHLEQYVKVPETNKAAWAAYSKEGVFIKIVSSIQDEINAMNANKRLTEQNPFASSLILTNDQSSHRPAIRIIPDIPIALTSPHKKQDPQDFLVMLNPMRTTVTRQHKINRINPAKNLSTAALIDKLKQMNAERCGQLFENYNQRYGTSQLEPNKCLTSFQLEAIFGIGVENSMTSSIKSLIFYILIASKKQTVTLFYYDALLGPIQIPLVSLFKLNQLSEGITALTKKKLSSLNIGLSPNDSKDPYNTLCVQSIENITCSAEKHPPSADYPLGFYFTHPLHPEIKLKAYVKNGIPVIKFLAQNLFIKDDRALLPQIAMQYQNQLLQSLDFFTLNVFLRISFGETYRNLKFPLIWLLGPNQKILITYANNHSSQQAEQAHALYKLLGLKNFYNASDIEIGSPTIQLRSRKTLPAIMALAAKIKPLTQLLETTVYQPIQEEKQISKAAPAKLKSYYLAFLACLSHSDKFSYQLNLAENDHIILTVTNKLSQINRMLPKIPLKKVLDSVTEDLSGEIFTYHFEQKKFEVALIFARRHGCPNLGDPTSLSFLWQHCQHEETLLALSEKMLLTNSFDTLGEDNVLALAIEKAKLKQDYSLVSRIIINHIKFLIENNSISDELLPFLSFLLQSELNLLPLLKDSYSTLILIFLNRLNDDQEASDAKTDLCEELIQLLTKYNTPFEVETGNLDNHHTAIHFAVLYNNITLLTLLWQRANPSGLLTKNAAGETPVDLAQKLAKENKDYCGIADTLVHLSKESKPNNDEKMPSAENLLSTPQTSYEKESKTEPQTLTLHTSKKQKSGATAYLAPCSPLVTLPTGSGLIHRPDGTAVSAATQLILSINQPRSM